MKLFCLGALFALSSASMAASMYFVDDSSDTLKTFNTTTLAVSTIGALGTGGDFGDMAYDGSTSTMYYIGGRGNENLYKLNLGTGAATLVGNYGISDMFGLAADGAGNLYADSTNGNFYKINKGTGAASLVGGNGIYPGGLTWDSANGRMIMAEAGGNGGIYSVNLGTGATTLLASPGFLNDDDIAYDAASNSYFTMDWSGLSYQYDSAFNRTQIASSLPSVAACEIVPVPEPATIVALGVSGLALLRRRRNK